MSMTNSGVSRISFRGGGFKNFWKSGVICMALCHAFARGVGGHAPPIIVLNGAIWRIFYKKNGNMVTMLFRVTC